MRARLEGERHPLRGLVEEPARQPPQQRRAEVAVDAEIYHRPALGGQEAPVRRHVRQGPVRVGDVDAFRRRQRDAGGEALAKGPEAHPEVGDDKRPLPPADARPGAPGNELGITLDIRDKGEHLIRRIGHEPLFAVARHQPRAAFSFAKSLSAW